MNQCRPISTLAAVASGLLLCGLNLGCRIDTHKQGDGDNVKIATPFGGMSVKTDNSSVQAVTGMTTYPGAIFAKEKDKNGHDSGAADINMSFGSFQLRVKAVSYRTPDAPDKVLEFYRHDLARYGTVIQCADHAPVGTPTRTSEGLDCSDDSGKNKKINMNEDISSKMELKAGSKQHQHIVAIDSEGTGTKFGLVALDLPGHFSFGNDDNDSDKPKQ